MPDRYTCLPSVAHHRHLTAARAALGHHRAGVRVERRRVVRGAAAPATAAAATAPPAARERRRVAALADDRLLGAGLGQVHRVDLARAVAVVGHEDRLRVVAEHHVASSGRVAAYSTLVSVLPNGGSHCISVSGTRRRRRVHRDPRDRRPAPPT